jgi:hypothetical protein
MKGKIDAEGSLSIIRKETYVGQSCMLANVSGETIPDCSHYCPQFGEPSGADVQGKSQLQICRGRILYFDEFVDERGG